MSVILYVLIEFQPRFTTHAQKQINEILQKRVANYIMRNAAQAYNIRISI